MKKIFGLFTLLTLWGFLILGFNSEASVSQNDFMMEAAQNNLAEIALGRLAAERAQSDEVKQYGQKWSMTIPPQILR